jgi:hypothetical protein
MKSLPSDQAQALLAHVQQDKNWVEKGRVAVQENSIDWFKNIYQKIGV